MTSGWRARRALARVRNRILAETDFSFMDWTGNSPGGPNVSPGANTKKTSKTAVQSRQSTQTRHLNCLGKKMREREESVSAPLRFPSHEPLNHLDCMDCMDQASIGAGLATSLAWTVSGPPGLARYPWTDDRAWIADMVCTRARAGKLAILAEWVAAAGGRIDGEVVLLPPLPRCLATLNLHRILGQFRIEVRDNVGL